MSLKQLKIDLEELDKTIEYWTTKRDETYTQIVSLVGVCKLCDNHHYPHCGESE